MGKEGFGMIEGFDHIVLTVSDPEATAAFYERALGLPTLRQGGRLAVACGSQKINLHRAGAEIVPHAARATPGGADFCLRASCSLDAVIRRLEEAGVAVELGPVQRSGALGPMQSVYFRDPDGNLVEIADYQGID